MRLLPWYRPTLEQRGMPILPVVPSPPAEVPPHVAGVRYVPNQVLTPAPGLGRLTFDIPHPVVLDDGAFAVVYVRGVVVPSADYVMTTDGGTGDGIAITFHNAPADGDLVTVSGFCRT